MGRHGGLVEEKKEEEEVPVEGNIIKVHARAFLGALHIVDEPVKALEEFEFVVIQLTHYVDVFKACCSPKSGLAQEAMWIGMTAERKTLETGYDLLKAKDAVRLKEEVKEKKPRKFWFSPPCTEFTSMQNLNQRNWEQWQRLMARRAKSRRLLRHGTGAIKEGLDNDIEFDLFWEWPLRCQGWSLPEVADLMRHAERRGRKVFFVTVNGCAFGMKDENGILIEKGWRIMTTDEEFAKVMGKRVWSIYHLHRKVEGGLTSGTAFYPYQMVHEIARIWKGQLRCKTTVQELQHELHLMLMPEEVFTAEGREFTTQEGIAKPTEKDREKVRVLLHKIHRGAGHCSNTNLAKLMRDKKCLGWIIEEAKDLKRQACIDPLRGEKLKVNASVTQKLGPHECVGMDVFFCATISSSR